MPADPSQQRDERPSGHPWKAVLAVLVVLGSSAAVAVGAAGAGLVLPPMEDEGWVRAVRIAGVVAVTAGLTGLVVQRRRIGPSGRHGPDPTAAALLSAGALMGLVLLVALLMPRSGSQAGGEAGPPAPVESGTIDPEAPRTDPPPPPSSTAPVTEGFAEGGQLEEPEWQVVQPGEAEAPGRREGGLDRELLRRAGTWLLAVLLAAVLVAAIVALRRRTSTGAPEVPSEARTDAADAEAGLEASLGEMAGDGDPRRQITAAYHRLLSALADAGAAREAHEAPYEHLRRALGPLDVEAGPMHRLTELYVVAQFGSRPVDEGHRARAVEALERSLDALRRSRHDSGAVRS